VSLVPVPSEQSSATCTNCGAELAADQRYCLACGQPASPVRLAFLDVLQGERSQSPANGAEAWGGQGTIEMSPAGYAPVIEQQGVNGWLRRNSGLLGLFAVLIMCLIAGLLVGHWVSQGNKAPSKQVVEVKGLSAAPAAAAATTTPATTAPATTAPASKSNAKAEAAEAKNEAKEAKVEKTKPVKVTATKLKKLGSSTGKQHTEEVNALGAAPIETG
jgi:zinc-ribbon domain